MIKTDNTEDINSLNDLEEIDFPYQRIIHYNGKDEFVITVNYNKIEEQLKFWNSNKNNE